LTAKATLREAALVERPDAELVGLTRGGDREAFGALVARYQGHVYGLAYSMVDNWAEAQDIAQETFIRAFTNLDQLRDPERFPAWLRRITFSVTINWIRAFRPGLVERLGDLDIDALDIPDFQPGPPEVVERRELADAVLRAVASLPPKYRVPLTMFHLDGLSYQKVADFLDVPLGTAKSLIHRAREKLKLSLAPYAEELTPMVQEVFNEHKLPAAFAQKVLDNVPTLGWGRQRECTFLGALEAALTPTAHPFSYTDMMGWSGMAFRTRWFAGNDSGARWCPSCAVAEMPEAMLATEKATGWPTRVDFMKEDDPATVARITERIVASIDAGMPVLAYEPQLNVDVVYGYEDRGKVLLLRDYFTPDSPLALPPPKLGFLIMFLGEHSEGLSRREALTEALRIAVLNWKRERYSEGPGAYWYGDAALKRWIEDIGEADQFSQEERNQLCLVGWWNYDTMTDARQAAVTFLRDNARLLSAEAQRHIARAADLYQQETEVLGAAHADREVFANSPDNWPAETRQRERDILTQARDIEERAVAELEKALAAV
jgi:RNA polymerase sigma-70 factor (ECF subfamily)